MENTETLFSRIVPTLTVSILIAALGAGITAWVTLLVHSQRIDGFADRLEKIDHFHSLGGRFTSKDGDRLSVDIHDNASEIIKLREQVRVLETRLDWHRHQAGQ